MMFSRRMAVDGEENGEWGQRRGKTWSSADEKGAIEMSDVSVTIRLNRV